MMGRAARSTLLLIFCLVLTFPVCAAERGAGAMAKQSLLAETTAPPTETPTVQSASSQVPFSPDILSDIERATLAYTLLNEDRSIEHTAE